MKYVLPLVLTLAVMGIAPARAEINCGPYLDEQTNQAKQSAIYAGTLKKEQQEQADQSALYAAELGKDQKAQASAAATYQTTLGVEQKDQATKAAAYAVEISKDQKAQADQAVAYAKVMSEHESAWRHERFKLCADQSRKAGVAVKTVEDTVVTAKPADKAPAPAPASAGSTTQNPADVNALKDPKKDLLKALKDIDEGK